MEFKFKEDKKTVQAMEPDVLALKMKAWPDCYYNEMEPALRRQLLDEAQRLHLTPEDNEIREFLFKKRYIPDKDQYIDVYLKPWLEFKFLSSSENGIFSKKRSQKKIRRLFEEMGDPEIRSRGKWAEWLLAREYEHCGLCYITLSSTDPAYRAVILGFGSVSDAKLYQRIYNDVLIVSVIVPSRFEMTEELSLWSESVKRALRRVYPDTDL